MEKNRLIQIYVRILCIHIQSLSTGTQFHKDTERAYEELFDVAHPILEMLQALGQQPTTDCEDSGQEAYDLIEEAKTIVEGLISTTKDKGYDNLLRGKLEDLNMLCGTFTQYTTKEDEDEEMEEEAEKKLPIPSKLPVKM